VSKPGEVVDGKSRRQGSKVGDETRFHGVFMAGVSINQVVSIFDEAAAYGHRENQDVT
jgi:hypothetical protein